MKTWVVAAMGVLVGAPLVAHAGFDIDPVLQMAMTPARPKAAPAAVVAEPPVATGAPASSTPPVAAPVGARDPSPAWNENVDGFAKGQSPERALSQIVPAGGKVIANAAWPAGKKVSWEGNNPRVVIAKKILSDIGLDGTFEGNNLVVGSAKAAAPSPAPSVAHNAQPEAAPPARLWTMAKGVMLSDGIQDWMEQTASGGERFRWTLDWDAFEGPNKEKRVDYKIVAPLRFSGSIDEAVAQLIVLYRKSPQPLVVQINLDQRVIHIKLRGSN